MSSIAGFNFTQTRAALEEMKSFLRCSVCQDTAVEPVCLGRCSHFFCRACLAGYPGGECPAPGCQVSAPAKDALPHTTIQQMIKSVFAIGELLCGDEVPTRLKSVSSLPEQPDEEFILTEIQPNTPDLVRKKKESLSGKKRPRKTIDQDSGDKGPVKTSKKQATPRTTAQFSPSHQLVLQAVNSEANICGTDDPGPGHNSDEQQQAAALTHERLDSPAVTASKQSSKKTNKRSTGSSLGLPDKRRSLVKKNLKGETALHAAAVRGDVAAVREFLSMGADPNTADHAGWTPLHEAAGAGRADIVELLLNTGANPNIHASEENLTPLHDAASHGYREVVRLLVAAGAEKLARNSQGRTAYDLAAGEEIITALNSTAVRAKTAPTPVETDALQSSRCQPSVASSGLDSVVVAWPDATAAEWKDMAAALAKIGAAKPSRQVGPTTTHCLVGRGDNKEKLAMLLTAQLVGCQLLQADWLWQSLQAGQLVSTELFQVESQSLSAEGRERSTECRNSRRPRLLAGLHVYLTGSFDESSLSKTIIQRLISLGGGKLLTREPDSEYIPEAERTVPQHAGPSSPLAATSHLILYEAGGRREPLLKYNMAHLKSLPSVWLVQSIVEHQLLDPALFR